MDSDTLVAVHSFQCQFCEEVFSSSIQIAQHWQDHHQEDCIREETAPVYQVPQTSPFTLTHSVPIHTVPSEECPSGNETFVENDGEEVTDSNQRIASEDCSWKHKVVADRVDAALDISSQAQRQVTNCESESTNEVAVTSSKSKAVPQSSSKDFCCELCGKTYTTTSNLNKHFLTHSGVLFKCGFCKKGFRYKESLKKHERNHLRKKNRKSDRGLACQYCHKIFPDRLKLSIHFRSHPLEKTYKCDQCERTFLYKSGLKRHILSHASVKAHICSQCNRSFLTIHNLKAHMKTHSGQKLFSCEKCDKAFAKKLTLMDHMRTHEDTRSYKCSHCGKGFRQRSTLWGHEKIHKREKTHACSKCEERFGTLKDLKRHEKKHWADSLQRRNTVQRNIIKDCPKSGPLFKCNQCGEVFSQKAVLKTHYRRHTGEMPFHCEVCGKKFRHLASHRRHVLTHKGVKNFHCDSCGKSFSKRSYLDWHLSKPRGSSGGCSKTVICKPSYVMSVNKGVDSEISASFVGCDNSEDDSGHCSSPTSHCHMEMEEEPTVRHKEPKFGSFTSKESVDRKSQQSTHNAYQTEILNTPENHPDPIEGPSLMVSFEEVCDVPINEECVHTMNIIDHVMQLAEISQRDLEDSQIPAKDIAPIQTDPVNDIEGSGESILHSQDINEIPSVGTENSRTVKQYVCELCGRMYSLNSSLKRHKQTHLVSKPHKCCFCDKSYSRKPLLQEHIAFSHSGLHNRHQCTYCEKSFPNATRLNLHIRTHTHDKPFKCGVCDKRFTDSSNLGRHERSHQGLRRHKCHQCGQLFSEKPALQRHLARHDGERVYQCQHCSKSFALKTDLQSHSILHQAAKDALCGLCGLSFQRQIVFKRHQACAKKSARKCRVCNAILPNECRRRQHEVSQHKLMITDSGFGCGYCHESFSKLTTTVRHIREHYELASNT